MHVTHIYVYVNNVCVYYIYIGVTISTDMISGFCGESEADHENSVRLMRETVFDQAFMVSNLDYIYVYVWYRSIYIDPSYSIPG